MADHHELFAAERSVFFSDAIFAIAITLLVLEIKLPDLKLADDMGLLALLYANWPKFVSFVLSFLIIAVVWFNHHAMFHYIRYVDHPLMLINTLLMLNVTVIPFCSALLGEFAAHTGENAVIAALIYGGWVALGGIPFNLIWYYVLTHEQLLKPGYQRDELLGIQKHFIRGPFLYLGCTLLALVHVWLSLFGFAVLIMLYFLPSAWWIKQVK